MKTIEVEAPELRCAKVSAGVESSWSELDTVFEGCETVELGQAWLDKPQPEFRPATVRAGWNEDALIVYAILEDDHIFNPVTEHNEPAFTKGDVFEIFLRPDGQDAYFEFHVNPQNQLFQLRIPSAVEFQTVRSRRGIPKDWYINDWKVASRVGSNHARSRRRTVKSRSRDFPIRLLIRSARSFVSIVASFRKCTWAVG